MTEPRPPALPRVYRSRVLIWIGPILGTAGIGFALLADLGPGSYSSTDLPIRLALCAIAIGLIWASWWPRLVVDRDGVRVYSLPRRKSIPWASINNVRVERLHIVLTVDGTELAPQVPSADIWGMGRQYMNRAAKDIETVWRHANESGI